MGHKLSNKIVINVGLCICLYDILEIEESHILPGDGCAYAKVRFRVLVFRPSVEEVVVGKIKSCTKDGVYVTLGFFDQIFIPSQFLQHPARYEEKENVWVWEYPLEEGHHDLYLDPGEQIRIKIVSETFTDLGPKKEKSPSDNKQTTNQTPTETEEVTPSYAIRAAINEPGLGVISWWS